MNNKNLHPLRTEFNLLKFHTKTWLAGCLFNLLGKKSAVLDGVEVVVPLNLTDTRLRGQFLIGSYERQERRFLKKYLNPEASVLELGGCIGVVSCVTNRLLRHPERHVVLEANPNLIPHLQRNKEFTGSAFTVENCIISNNPQNRFLSTRPSAAAAYAAKPKAPWKSACRERHLPTSNAPIRSNLTRSSWTLKAPNWNSCGKTASGCAR